MKKTYAFILSFIFSLGGLSASVPLNLSDYENDESDIFDIDDSLLIVDCPNVAMKPTYRVNRNGPFSHVFYSHITPNNTLLPEYLIIVEKNIFLSLTKEIKTYAEDVHAVFGYGIILEYVENPNPDSLKTLIVNYQNNLCGVFLIGDMGECYFEAQNDYGKYGYRIWPCDLFFMDLDGIWTDSDSNGVYDTHSGNVAPEIFLGRLSTAGLSSYGNEADLIRRQLKKSHDYWWKTSYHAQSTTLNYIDKSWISWFPASTIKKVFSTLAISDVRYSYDPNFSVSDYLSRITSNIYGFTHLAAHSSPLRHAFTNNYIYNNQIKTINSNNYAYNLYCCSACNWTEGDTDGYLGGAYLFNNGKTIAVVGSTKIGGMRPDSASCFYTQLPFKNLGESYLHWWRQYGDNHSDNCRNFHYGMTILGDPTIDFRYQVSDRCVNNLYLTTFPIDNFSNLIMYKARNLINVSGNFVIPQGVHVIFDAPQVVFEENFSCPLGASFETRSEGCEL